MTLVGKIFTGLILVMSVAFMMLAVSVYVTHRDWNELVQGPDGLKERIEELHAANERLRGELEKSKHRLATEQAARTFALASLQSRLTDANNEVQERASELADLQAKNGQLVETLNTNQINLEQLTEEVGTLRDQIRTAQEAVDEKFGEVVQLTEQLHDIEGTRQQLQERQDQLIAQNKRMKHVLQRNELTEHDEVDEIPPRVDGVVTAVGEKDLIEVSIGADDGLRQGHTLEVYRNNTYLGRIMIQRTDPDRSVGKILRDYRKGTIRKGDRVASKLT